MDRIDTSIFLLRAVFGIFLAFHGINKIRGGLAGTAGWFGSIGMRWPMMQARMAATTEIAAGLAFAAGLLTPIASAAIIATMLVAIVTVHWKVGFFIFLPNGGWEYCASIICVAATVALAGPGEFSLDEAMGTTFSATWGVSGIVLGIVAAFVHLLLSWRPQRSRS